MDVSHLFYRLSLFENIDLLFLAVKKKSGLEDSTISITSTASDSEEEIINEFVPSPHPSLLSTLSKAAGRDSDGDHTPSRLTPEQISRGPSREQSDNGM